MVQIHYKITELVSLLSNKLDGHKLKFCNTYQHFQLDLHSINLDQGLYFLSAKITLNYDVEFIQVGEETHGWTVLHYLEKSVELSNGILNSGVYTGFNDRTSSFTVKAPQSFHLSVILMHQSFVNIHNYTSLISDIRSKSNGLFYQKINNKIIRLTECFLDNRGLIRIKKNVIELLNVFKFEVDEIELQLTNNIDFYCSLCVEKQISLFSFLLQEFDFEKQVMETFFIEIFGICPQTYFHNFKLDLAKKYLKSEKDSLNAFLRQNINQHRPPIEPLAAQFGLTPRLFNRLFVEEFGKSLTYYYRKLRITLANEYLQTDQTKVYQASQVLGYSQTISFIKSFRKIEGVTPGKWKEI